MSDPVSTPSFRPAEPGDDAAREARIEELLLSGLDHYFAGQYERAIGVWTRIIFLDRHHDRARAYIERARSALAERQRESDELLHTGVAAYEAGDIHNARELLTRAVEQGSDTANVFLDRLNRVGRPAGVAIDPRIEVRPAAGPAPRMPRPPSRSGWALAGVIAAGVAVMMLLSGVPIGTWLSEAGAVAPGPAQPLRQEPVAIIRSSDVALSEARSLYADGHLHDALRVLDRITLADPARSEADRLRADIQRDLLAAAGIPSPVVEERDR